MTGAWQPDLLGDGFEQLTLPLEADAEGPVVATLVRRLPRSFLGLGHGPLRDVDVLYVHGWSDYFFQTEVAKFWNDLGARFYALDLRKYGRSLRDGQTPGYITDLETYDEDIAAARAEMDSGRRLVLQGHSTGGLILALWASRHARAADALVLNSPWLELQIGAIARQTLAPIVGVRARFDPLGTHPVLDLGFYTRAQTEVGALPVPGYQSAWRPPQGFPTHPGWFAAILEGHRRVAARIEVGCPALVLLSTRTTPPLSWREEMTSSDSVLVVDDIARAATRLGSIVTIGRIDGAIHDVFLSRPEPRASAYRMLRRWVTGVL
ncbi:alpha/beta hydrolase [Microbacterium terricola]|uniref:Lysophospholipase n=1 Tax=Microbacterium terricola TaxID=344163 RepID=A0ABM8E1I6_9MICO|nr:alpha/beta hydrolase [Microbacterium terricola]UYK40622.1 alpha/beta hydrolase [Microbacterium terricola]BDV31646.1 lysophospholipase [Microbacterium terricola]